MKLYKNKQILINLKQKKNNSIKHKQRVQIFIKENFS